MPSDIVVCPQCKTHLQNSLGIAGQIVACPQCQTQLQMPDLSQAVAGPQLPSPAALPPAIELPPPAQFGAATDSAFPASGPMAQTNRPTREAAASVADRLRTRSNPLAIGFVVVMALVVIAVGAISFLGQQADQEKSQFARRMIGNWELVPGQKNLDRWDFAFHADGELQMALGSQLNEGRWEVTSLQGQTGYVLIAWPDDAPQTLRVRLESGRMQVELDGVGNFAFRAAVP
ncbi:MAG: hypothetical protein O3C40_16860 [Planctomycetota bacterium]|nr:hypothetical protein [Planctomycetota bacterium]